MTPVTNPRLAALAAHGVSIWLDDLSRERIASGNLAELIAEDSVTGVTTNPSIFQAALPSCAPSPRPTRTSTMPCSS